MQAMFTENGTLALKRAGRWVDQECFISGEPCSESCPQMSEPIRRKNAKLDRDETVIHICQGRHWKFTEFEDRRHI